MNGVTRAKPFHLLLLQQPGWGTPASEEIQENVDRLVRWLDRELSRAASPVDLAVFPELSTTPYFCCREDSRYFAWAEAIPGETTRKIGEVARRHATTVIVPLFERAADGSYYNAAAIVGPDGKMISGAYASRRVDRYRKCHIPHIDNPPDTEAYEDYFFSPGQALPVFSVSEISVGVLICYDRWFPEAWRVLASEGAQLVVVPMVAWGFVEGPYLPMLQSRAVENGIFAATCNRSGAEELDGVRMRHFGQSMVIAPDGRVVAQAHKDAEKCVLDCVLNVAEVEEQRRVLPLLRDRRLDLYSQSPPEVLP